MKALNKFKLGYLYQNLKFCSTLCSENEYQNNIEIMKTANIRSIWKSTITQLTDVKISANDWQNICSHISTRNNGDLLNKRLPKILIGKFLVDKKLNILDSFLMFILKEKSYHDPYTLISLMELKLPRYFLDQYIKLYEECVNEKQFEFLFPTYIKLVLKSSYRQKGLQILENRKRNLSFLSSIIKYSPITESWSDIKRYVEEYFNLNGIPTDVIERSILKKLIKEDSLSVLKDVLKSLNGKCEYITLHSIICLIDIFEGNKGFQLTMDTARGLMCRSCDNKMEEANLNRQSCDDVANILMTDVMKVDDIDKLYQSGSPDILKRFDNFYRQCNLPFDCVIDLMNFILCDSQTCHFGKKLINLLQLNSNFKNLCFIGKQMSSINRRILVDIQTFVDKYNVQSNNNITISCFFTDNFTKDDLLLLYTALKSGPDCFLVTNDEFRDHRVLISDPALRSYLSKWQSFRQIKMQGSQTKWILKDTFYVNIFIDGDDLISFCQIPSQINNVIAHAGDDNVWHIPYLDEERDKFSYKNHIKWACLKLE